MTRRIEVTNTALVSWLERTGQADFSGVREAIADSLSSAVEAATVLGVGEFLILADGLVYVVRDSTLVGVSTEDGRHKHARLLARRAKDGSGA